MLRRVDVKPPGQQTLHCQATGDGEAGNTSSKPKIELHDEKAVAMHRASTRSYPKTVRKAGILQAGSLCYSSRIGSSPCLIGGAMLVLSAVLAAGADQPTSPAAITNTQTLDEQTTHYGLVFPGAWNPRVTPDWFEMLESGRPPATVPGEPSGLRYRVCGDPDAGNCCVDDGNNSPGCNHKECCELVCSFDFYCCEGPWDEFCREKALGLDSSHPGATCWDACYGCGQPGAGDCCTNTGTPACSDTACCKQVCQVDSFCCKTNWDLGCAQKAADLCGMCACLDEYCGNGVCNQSCEESCESCPDDCHPPDDCPYPCPGEGDCCTTNPTPGCNDETCCLAVCNVAPFCCISHWDQNCVTQARQLCGCRYCGDSLCSSDLGEDCESCPQDCGVCPLPCPGQGSCCQANGSGSCNDEACCLAVCSLDKFCCLSTWDNSCAEKANRICCDLCPSTACGDGVCDSVHCEDCHRCPRDCGSCPAEAELREVYSVVSDTAGGTYELLLVNTQGQANNVEPRRTGVTHLRLEFSDTVTTLSATVECYNQSYNGTVSVNVNASKTVQLEFTRDPLPDQDCCTIILAGDCTDRFKVRTLKGDINRDGGVSTSDAALIKAQYQKPVTTTNFLFDYTNDGQISTSDASLIKALYQHQAPACP